MTWWIQKNGRTIGRPLAVLTVAALVGGYLLGWLSTLADESLDRPVAETPLAPAEGRPVGGAPGVLGQPPTDAPEMAGDGTSGPRVRPAIAEGAATPPSPAKRLIVIGDGAALREAPGADAAVVDRLAAGTTVTVLEGLIIQDGFAWYRLDVAGTFGWMAGAFLSPG